MVFTACRPYTVGSFELYVYRTFATRPPHLLSACLCNLYWLLSKHFENIPASPADYPHKYYVVIVSLVVRDLLVCLRTFIHVGTLRVYIILYVIVYCTYYNVFHCGCLTRTKYYDNRRIMRVTRRPQHTPPVAASQ